MCPLVRAHDYGEQVARDSDGDGSPRAGRDAGSTLAAQLGPAMRKPLRYQIRTAEVLPSSLCPF
jgi:hypothetical protein